MGLTAHFRQTLLDAGHYERLVSAFEAGGQVGRRPPFDPALAALGGVLQGKLPMVLRWTRPTRFTEPWTSRRSLTCSILLGGPGTPWKTIDPIVSKRTSQSWSSRQELHRG